ncbi:DUF4838 domain-containing protein [Paenibacillus sp. 598K]|uniref:DUF4838 domain-containing protein n=1 Tax=Paenibacillus sp. 598K TaxID=1117987 RepID=UPI000FFA256A|nr:DUF4838 domain-containing protein [Paenibacillus sp. 598K]GBF77705.1 DUF4838 domain-containing protein [Paenibacillus sp. 598K]
MTTRIDREGGDAIALWLPDRQDETIGFAAAELSRCLAAMTGCAIVQVGASERAEGSRSGIALCLQEEGETGERPDGIRIEVEDDGTGVIAGTNPRSVLIAVYRYLHALGCRWVRPGRTGEHLPRIAWPAAAVAIREEASHRHRGICLEGAVGIEHVLDMIDWMPKLGLNSYFIQFKEAFTFFERWYKDIEVSDTLGFMEQAVAAIRKRGLLYHAVGHGWTCNALGLPGLGWEKIEWQGESDAELAALIAEVDGERKLWKGVPLDTELCYSNAKARQRMIDEATAYASAHSEIDYLHVWLSDGMNNQCECELCTAMTPSDWYVLLLNELDERLSELGLATRIVFLIYQELLWRPLQEKLARSERFVLMFAPITRTYRQSFAEAGARSEPPPFVRNRIELPRTIAENLAFLEPWQASFAGDSFDFDYHLMWAQQRDPGHMKLARILHADIQALSSLGLNGYMSCQVQRNCFPNGLAMTVMGRTLWDREVAFDTLAEDYYADAYGKYGNYCLNLLNFVSELYDNINLEDGLGGSQSKAEYYASVTAELERFEPVIAEHLTGLPEVQARSWRQLELHRQLWLAMTDIFHRYDAGETEQGHADWQRLQHWLWEIESEVADVFDVYNFILVIGWILDRPGQPITNDGEAISCED